MFLIGFIVAYMAVGLLFVTIDAFSESKWFCENLNWHRPPKALDEKGLVCPRCGKNINYDERGGWVDNEK